MKIIRMLLMGMLSLLAQNLSWGQTKFSTMSGVVLDDKGSAIPGATVTVGSDSGQIETQSGSQGEFSVQAPVGPLTIKVTGRYLVPVERKLAPGDSSQDIEIHIRYAIPPLHENIIIKTTALDPTIDRRDDAVYKNTLFSRDDQIFDTLAAGINAGQHEGGGKSLEIRRFGFNLDHGGVNGGLKVLIDDVQQNQGTQGHGQGYLGSLKSLSPELVQDVDILNGPFSAEYGDFSGLGVVHIHQKESLPYLLTARLQAGSFGARRAFIAYSPQFSNADAFISYEGALTNGPFFNPLGYRRDNVTANYTWHLSKQEAIGFKFNFGRNDFSSSGQIPLDLALAGQMDRFGFVDPYDGGFVGLGTFGTYYRKELSSGDIFKVDGFVSRSLFDLYSNFTFFLKDPIHGDEFQQHDSRLQEGGNTQYLHPFTVAGHSTLLTFGGNFHDNEINVGLLHTERRKVLEAFSSAHAHVTNAAGYLQQGIDLLQGRLHFDAGLRMDYFRFQISDQIVPIQSGTQGAGRFQPKANAAYTPSKKIPLTIHASYGCGISSQDARGVVQRPDGPRLATTDFSELGVSLNHSRVSLSTDVFLIDRSNEQVYVPDDGSFEFMGPSRSYGWEAKTSIKINHHLNFNGGITQVSNAFYRGTFPRLYVDSAPHTVANSSLVLGDFHGFSGSLRYRHTNAYRLDGLDPAIRATGLDVVDLSMVKTIHHGMDLNFTIDNLNNKQYWETQNYFESRLTPTGPIVARIHGTPGYPVSFTVGLTFRLFEK